MPETRCNTAPNDRPPAPPLAWAGSSFPPIIIAAPGPSLTGDVIAAVRARRLLPDPPGLLAVTGAVLVLPDADLVYAADGKWWDAHDGLPGYAGDRWIQDKGDGAKAAERWGLSLVASASGNAPRLAGAVVSQGHNSAFQALNLSVLMGARRVVLIGLDLDLGEDGRKHCFGDYAEPRLNIASPYPLFRRAFEAAAPVYAAAGIEIVNASTRSALTCFPRVTLEEALAWP